MSKTVDVQDRQSRPTRSRRSSRWLRTGAAALAALGVVSVAGATSASAEVRWKNWRSASHGCAYITGYSGTVVDGGRLVKVTNDCGAPVAFEFYVPGCDWCMTSFVKSIGTGARDVVYASPIADPPPTQRLHIIRIG